jgi:hypothetical protein
MPHSLLRGFALVYTRNSPGIWALPGIRAEVEGAHRARLVVRYLPRLVARYLLHPTCVRVAGDAAQTYTPGAYFDEEQDDALQ